MNNPLEDGIAALKAGKRDEAHRLLSMATAREPNNPRAWKMFYNVSQNDAERKNCLRHLAKLSPTDPQVQELLQQFPDYKGNSNAVLVFVLTLIVFPALVWILYSITK